METKIIRGDLIKDKIFSEVRAEVAMLKAESGLVPGIAFLGFNCTPLAKYNIPMHVRMAQSMGFRVLTEIMPDDSTEEDVFLLIDHLNTTSEIDAIVLLQPLPDHLNPVRLVNRINPAKEVEGFHPQNILSTMVPDIHTTRYPMCLPEALFEMFLEAGVRLPKDQDWVFVLDDGFLENTLTKMIVRAAASRVVPDDCSVTFLNRQSAMLADHCLRADVLVVVSKFTEYIQPEWIKPGACIIDIYSNLVKEVPSKEDPDKLVPVIRGGVNVESVTGIASVLLPIPGGLMTVVLAILFRNTLMAFMNSGRKADEKRTESGRKGGRKADGRRTKGGRKADGKRTKGGRKADGGWTNYKFESNLRRQILSGSPKKGFKKRHEEWFFPFV